VVSPSRRPRAFASAGQARPSRTPSKATRCPPTIALSASTSSTFAALATLAVLGALAAFGALAALAATEPLPPAAPPHPARKAASPAACAHRTPRAHRTMTRTLHDSDSALSGVATKHDCGYISPSSMRRGGTSIAVVMCIAGIACTLKTSGLGDATDAQPDSGIVTPSDASLDVDAPPVCPAPAPNAGNLVASRAPGEITLDGLLEDWGCTPFVHLTSTLAGYAQTNGANATVLVADFAVLWDDEFLYVAARITDPSVLGSDPTNPFLNDAIEIYVAGDTPNGDYGPATHRYVVDHENLAVEYQYRGTPPMTPSPPGFLSAAQATPTGYAIEVRIAASAIGATTLASGKTMGFDFALDDGDGTQQQVTLVWINADAPAASCSCAQCCCLVPSPLPFCDTRRFGKLTLL